MGSYEISFILNTKVKQRLIQKVVLQYYINRKKCGDKEQAQYTAPNHGNSGAEKPFFPIKKSTLQNFKKQFSQKGKRVISVLYDNVTRTQNEDSDYGDLPRSKKQLIDLSRSSLMDKKVGDILAYNKELNNDAIAWHHSDFPDDLWVIGTENIAAEMANAITLPISVDPRFNFGV